MTQQEYNFKGQKCWEEYLRKQISEGKSSYSAFLASFDYAYALGKQEKDAENAVIQGWVARDNDSQGLYLYGSAPTRGIDIWNGHGSLLVLLDAKLYPDLTWDSDPIEVELIIKRKKNGNNSPDNRI